MSVLAISPLIGISGVRLDGELDLATVPRLTEVLLEFESEREVHLDLATLTFVDSSGLHVILDLARSDDSDRSVVLLNPCPAVMRSLEIAGIDTHPAVEIRRSSAAVAA